MKPANNKGLPRSSNFAVAGLIAGALGLAIAELFVGLNEKRFTSPILSVGNKAVDLVPVPVKNFAIRTFGTHDKQALLVGIFSAVAVFALVVGIVGRRRPAIAVGLFGAFGAVGILAATTGRTGRLRDAIPSAIAAIIGALSYLVLRRVALRRGRVALRRSKATTNTVPSESAMLEAVDEALPSRREFVAFAGVFTIAAVGVGTIGRKLQSGAAASARRLGLTLPRAKQPLAALPPTVEHVELAAVTPFITPNADFYRIDTALTVPRISVDTWKLRVHGMVDRELSFSFDELLERALVERDITLTCVSNEVGGILMGTARWLGVPIRELLDEAGVDPKSTQVVGRSVDGWTSGFPTAVINDGRDALIAVGMNGDPLPFTHGYPARLIVPGLYGYVSATKWLTEIELTTLEKFDAYWVPRGYAKQAPIKLASRIDVPRGLSTVPAGKTAIAGVAWAQRRGISKVEVRIDNGPWTEAQLADEATVDTWRQWKFEWDATTGQHEIAVRATDGNGKLQVEQRQAPLPNGATGWHSIVVFVSGT